jgi:hypothetical protein
MLTVHLPRAAAILCAAFGVFSDGGGISADGSVTAAGSFFAKLPFDFELFEDFSFKRTAQLGETFRPIQHRHRPPRVSTDSDRLRASWVAVNGDNVRTLHIDHILHCAKHQKVVGLCRYNVFFSFTGQLCGCDSTDEYIPTYLADLMGCFVCSVCQAFPIAWVWWVTYVVMTAVLAGVGELACYFCRDMREMKVDH